MMSIKNFGVDLSAWNDIYDYDDFLKSTYDGHPIKYAFLRIGYRGKRDVLFDKHYNALHGRVYIGVYVYSYARTPADARAEAEWVIENLHGYDINFPVVFDYEDVTVLHPKMTARKYTETIGAFMDTINAAGYYAMLYCNPNFIENYADKTALIKYPLWLSHYVPDGKQRQYGQFVWQFGTFRPAGTNGTVDGNFAYKQLGKIIRENGYNNPKRYTLTARNLTEKQRAELTDVLERFGIDNYTFE